METNDRVEAWEDDFRKQFDELKLKPPKNSMKNAERELIIWYFRNLITTHDQSLHTSLVAAVEGKKETPLRNVLPEFAHTRTYINGYNQALDDTLTIINSIFKE